MTSLSCVMKYGNVCTLEGDKLATQVQTKNLQTITHSVYGYILNIPYIIPQKSSTQHQMAKKSTIPLPALGISQVKLLLLGHFDNVRHGTDTIRITVCTTNTFALRYSNREDYILPVLQLLHADRQHFCISAMLQVLLNN